MVDGSGRRRVLALTGPTAVGKTAVAMALADRLPVALISMDSALIYRGMDIGTAKPDAATLERYPHALLDVRDPVESYSVADFVADADKLVAAAWERGELPVLVGGTMLYLRGFREGLAPLPAADAELRAQLAAEAAEHGWPALHARLAQLDPEAAAQIHPNNSQRVQRALEVHALTGKTLSDIWREQRGQGCSERLGGTLDTVALLPGSRSALHQQIGERFAAMLDAGLVEEVSGLRERGDLHLGLPSMRAVGYRQTWQHLDGAFDIAELALRGAAATRQLAKRQLTWIRSWDWVREHSISDLDEILRMAAQTAP